MSTTKTFDSVQIDIPIEKIVTLCQHHHIHEFALFGSVLRDDFGPDSDIDVLIKFDPDVHIGYFRFFGIEQELTNILKREVELFTPDSLKSFAREEALKTCKVIYAA
ncbi:MAG: nucleotidyltransferase family protein [Anaerolineae bacterium]|nr:nucleotidyltransferase family protein [Anaerolineae bacterium]